MREFDYVIVGAGSAGCVLAERLSADRGLRVLLLEAGGWDWYPLLRIPLGVGRIWGFGRFDWGYETEPEPHAADRRIETARGKVIGGCHSINAMGHVRGHRSDPTAGRAWGWAAGPMPRFFPISSAPKPGKAVTRPFAAAQTRVRAADRNIDPLYEAYIQAGVKPAIPLPMITTARSSTGSAGHMDHPQWPARQHARAYLHPALGRRYLRVEVNALRSGS